MITKPNYYLVPKSIADAIGLTEYRQSFGGKYLLSEFDINSYGMDKAEAQGAEKISAERASELINSTNN
jgi:hypothetical protein